MSAIDKILEPLGLKLEYEDEPEEETNLKVPVTEKSKQREFSPKEPAKKSLQFEKHQSVHQEADEYHPLVILLRPSKIADAQHICDELKAGKTVVVNVEELSKDEIVRLYDFVSGVRYALEAKTMDITENVFVVAPYNVDVKMGDTPEATPNEYLDDDDFDDEDF